MKKAMTAFLLTCSLGVSILFGQTPTPTPTPGRGNRPNPPTAAELVERRVQRLTTILGLTEAQQQQATNFFTTAASTSTNLLSSLRTARQNLHTAIQNNDLNSINQVASQIGTLTAQLTTAFATAQANFYNILTPDQREKLNALGGRRRGMFGLGPMGMDPMFGPGGGPGGPGGPGHGPRGRGGQ